MKERFISTKSLVDAWFIKDTKDDSIVCIMQRGKRGKEKTRAMLAVMLKALNRAVAPQNNDYNGVAHE